MVNFLYFDRGVHFKHIQQVDVVIDKCLGMIWVILNAILTKMKVEMEQTQPHSDGLKKLKAYIKITSGVVATSHSLFFLTPDIPLQRTKKNSKHSTGKNKKKD